MKQISTGTGLVVLSGTILASVFLSSPRTASTAFASAQQAQPAERGVGRDRGSDVRMVADCQSSESLQWFSATPKEIQGGCQLGVVAPTTSPSISLLEADINNDGIGEYFIYDYFEKKIYLSTIETISGVATSKLILVFILNDQLINDYRSSVGLSSDGYWNVLGLRDCDNDGDMDVVIDSFEESMYFENTGFQHAAALEGDLNGDGHVDSEDLGRLLGGYTG
jgi:hypothetical protein